jgi:cytochrome b561
MSRPSDSYSPAQKALHWGIALLIAIQVPIGLTMAGKDPSPVINTLYETHKSFGLVIFGLALIRAALRWRRGAPALEPDIPAWQRAAAYISHYSLYVLIVLVPLAGWAATSACCAPVNLFWTVPLTLPVSGGMDVAKMIFKVHYALAFTLTAIVLVHAAAALHHHFVRRDRTLIRMLPASGREGQQVRMSNDARGT